MALTLKQQMFVVEYLKDLNATQAAIRAGYSEKSARDIGCELLAKPHIQEAIATAMAERSERTKIDADWVLRQAVKLHERCMQEIEPVLDRKGDQVIDCEGRLVFGFNTTGAAKSLELIGRHVDVQAFKERHELTGRDGEPIEMRATTKIDVSELTDEQLRAIATIRVKP